MYVQFTHLKYIIQWLLVYSELGNHHHTQLTSIAAVGGGELHSLYSTRLTQWECERGPGVGLFSKTCLLHSLLQNL